MIVQKRREKDIIQELVVKNDPGGQFSDSGEVNEGGSFWNNFNFLPLS